MVHEPILLNKEGIRAANLSCHHWTLTQCAMLMLILHFQNRQFSTFFRQNFRDIGSWVNWINWCEGLGYGSTHMVVRLSERRPLFSKKGQNAYFAIKMSYFGQPDSHIGWATFMPLASIYLINLRTNPWNFSEKILRIGGFENLSFFWVSLFEFFFKKKNFLASSHGVEWMGLNFYDNRGFQPNTTHPKHSWSVNTYPLNHSISTFPFLYQRIRKVNRCHSWLFTKVVEIR